MTTYRISGIDYDFERTPVSDTGNEGRVPPSWVYMIKPPDDAIGGLDTDKPVDVEYIARLKQEGFIKVSPDIYDKFLRSRWMKAVKQGGEVERAHIQARYTLQHLRVAMFELDENQMTWAEWAEHTPSSLGYPQCSSGYIDCNEWKMIFLEMNRDKAKDAHCRQGNGRKIKGTQAQLKA